MSVLPPGFDELEVFVPHWDVPTSDARWHRRAGTEFDDIKRFYRAMFSRAEEAATYCEQFELDDMPDDAARLFRLLLALTQASIAVELHGASRVPNSPLPHSLGIARGMTPYG